MNQALGTILDPRVRRKRVRDVLFGGTRKPYRSLPRGPLNERNWEKPPGAGDRKGWKLVQFALFGEDGPHLKRPDKTPVEVKQEKGSSEESSSEEEEGDDEDAGGAEVVEPVRAGFVQVLCLQTVVLNTCRQTRLWDSCPTFYLLFPAFD